MLQEEKEDVVEENMEDMDNTFLSFTATCSCATTDILISFSAILADMGRELVLSANKRQLYYLH